MYGWGSSSEELSFLNLELGNPLNSFEVPFVQLFLLVTDDRVAFRDFGLEGRDSRVVVAGGGTEGSVLLL
jgi:hypothetical protein